MKGYNHGKNYKKEFTKYDFPVARMQKKKNKNENLKEINLQIK